MRYPITFQEALAQGITRSQLRSKRWRRVGPAQYAPAADAADVELQLEAARRRLPMGSVFSDRTAAWLHGLDLPPCRPIQVIVSPDARVSVRSGIAVRRTCLQEKESALTRGFPVTSAVRTVQDLASRQPLWEAVIAVDAAIHQRLVEIEELMTAADRIMGKKGIRQLRRVLKLTDGRAESPMETRLRLTLVLNGLPRPLSQVALHDRHGRFVGRPDFLYPDAKLCIEFDGGIHREQLVGDDRRQNALVRAGYKILRFTGADLRDRSDAVVRDVRWALMQRSPVAIRQRMVESEAAELTIRRRMASSRR